MTAHRPPTILNTFASDGPARRASIYAALGLAADPFPRRSRDGVWIDIPSRATILTAIDEWLAAPGEAPWFGIVSGDAGSGRSRLLHVLAGNLAARDDIVVSAIASAERRWSDRELVRAIIAGFGVEPIGRTGLELIAEARVLFLRTRGMGRRPLVLVDDASLAGSQLEVLQSLVAPDASGTNAPDIRFILAGPPELADRIQRRRTLRPLITDALSLPPLDTADVTHLVNTRVDHLRLNDQDGRSSSTSLFEDEAIALLTERTAGNLAAINMAAGESLLETIARSQTVVDGAIVHHVIRELTDHARAIARAADRRATVDPVIQTRLDLGFPDEADNTATTPRSPQRRRRSGGGGTLS